MLRKTAFQYKISSCRKCGGAEQKPSFSVDIICGSAVPIIPSTRPPRSQNQPRIAALEPASAIPSHHKEPGTRIPASFQNAQKGYPLRQNHPGPVFDTAARDAARVSSSNSWGRDPDRRSNIPRHLRFLFFENGSLISDGNPA